MTDKRKRHYVSIETKLEAIKRIDKGDSIKEVAKDLGVGQVTVGDWRRKRSKLEQWCEENNINNKHRKTMKQCKFVKTSEALFLWFAQLRENGSPVSGPMLQSKALEFNKIFYDQDFTASVGWLDRWKKRYGIRQLNITGEKLSANCTEAKEFKNTFKKLIIDEHLSPDQIFNCDETGLNYRMLPVKTLASNKERSAPGFKKSKERVTILACANASGNFKLKPMLIGKSKKPRAFKNVNILSLPIYYKYHKNSWMSSELFKDWFFNLFVPEVTSFLASKNLPIKALLLLDNAPCHPREDALVCGDIKACFLPPNVTSLIQPLDQGVFENIKRCYRKKLLKFLHENLDEGKGVIESLKILSLKDVVYWVSQAWEDLKPLTLQKSWRKLLGEEGKGDDEKVEDFVTDESLLNLAHKLPQMEAIDDQSLIRWFNFEERQELSDDEIVNIVSRDMETSDEEKQDELIDKISHADGLAAIQRSLKYIEQQEEATSAILLNLKQWRDIAAEKYAKQSTQ